VGEHLEGADKPRRSRSSAGPARSASRSPSPRRTGCSPSARS
jgi:hypothetical protein